MSTIHLLFVTTPPQPGAPSPIVCEAGMPVLESMRYVLETLADFRVRKDGSVVERDEDYAVMIRMAMNMRYGVTGSPLESRGDAVTLMARLGYSRTVRDCRRLARLLGVQAHAIESLARYGSHLGLEAQAEIGPPEERDYLPTLDDVARFMREILGMDVRAG